MIICACVMCVFIDGILLPMTCIRSTSFLTKCTLWKESLNSDGQQIYQYQQNKQPHRTSNLWTLERLWHNYEDGNSGSGFGTDSTNVGLLNGLMGCHVL